MYKSYSDLGNDDQPVNKDLYLVPELTNSNEKHQVLNQNNFVLINIHADWCGPCKATAPEFSILAKMYSKPGVAIVKYNYEKMDQNEKTNIHGIPVYQFFIRTNGGMQQVDQIVGADIKAVEEKLKQYLGQEQQNVSFPEGPQAVRNRIRAHKNTMEGMQQPSHYMDSQSSYGSNEHTAGNSWAQPYSQFQQKY